MSPRYIFFDRRSGPFSSIHDPTRADLELGALGIRPILRVADLHITDLDGNWHGFSSAAKFILFTADGKLKPGASLPPLEGIVLQLSTLQVLDSSGGWLMLPAGEIFAADDDDSGAAHDVQGGNSAPLPVPGKPGGPANRYLVKRRR